MKITEQFRQAAGSFISSVTATKIWLKKEPQFSNGSILPKFYSASASATSLGSVAGALYWGLIAEPIRMTAQTPFGTTTAVLQVAALAAAGFWSIPAHRLLWRAALHRPTTPPPSVPSVQNARR